MYFCEEDFLVKKSLPLLDLADCICRWLAEYNEKIDSQIIRLNQLQIIKRRRALEIQEVIELGKFSEDMNAPNIRCGAYLLLGDTEKAQQCFYELSKESQEEFLTFPICFFGALKMNGGKRNG